MSQTQIKNLMADLKLLGMLHSLEATLHEAAQDNLSLSDLLDSLLQAEYDYREQKKTLRYLKNSRLNPKYTIEDFDFTAKRNISKTQIKQLYSLDWIRKGQPLILMGPTGVGKTFIAQALGHHACHNKMMTLFLRISTLLENLALARTSGNYLKYKDKLIKPHLLILDDFGLAKFNSQQAHDLCEILEERIGEKSTLITTQLPIEHFSEVIEDPVIADAIIDRLIHTSMKLTIKGESYRKTQAKMLDQKTLNQ